METILSLADPMLRLSVAVLVGGLIGLDRAYQGRPAGFRTHILVCLASAVLMLLMDYQWQAIPAQYSDSIRVDPTRMAQGIMTGIGFLGAGVIMQDKQVVRGLTTAASIWVTAAIGIIIGAGYYSAALMAAALTLLALIGLSNVTRRLPIRHYASLTLRFKRHESLSRAQVQQLLDDHQVGLSNFSYELTDGGNIIAYQLTVHASGGDNFERIAVSLLALETIQEFSLRLLSD